MNTPSVAARIVAGVVFFGLVAAIIAGIVWFVTSANPNDDTATLNRIKAEETCQDIVRDQLKAPSTASFSDVDTSAAGDAITGHVDAQNSFGAAIRNTFACEVDLATHTVTLTSLQAGQ